MENTSFLARKTLGQPNYLVISLVAVFLLALAPYSVWQAVQLTSTRTEEWLPPTCAEAQDLAWFRANFLGEQFVLVSWEGCTLGNAEKLELLAKKLGGRAAASSKRGAHAALNRQSRWYDRVITGPDVLAELTSPPLGLKYDEAVRRIEGTLAGPPQRDPHGRSLGDGTRATCLVANLSPVAMRSNKSMRAAIDNLVRVAHAECGIDTTTLRLGGPPVSELAVDAETQRMATRMACLAGIAGVILCYWRLRNWGLTAIVVAVGFASAMISLAIVYYLGAFELLLLNRPTSRMGTVDALLMIMPAIAYILGISSALYTVHCYRLARREGGLDGAAERAAEMAWAPVVIAAFTMAVGLAVLGVHQILPVQRFGIFTAAGVLAAAGAALAIVPVWLHRFPLSDSTIQQLAACERESRVARGVRAAFRWAVQRRAASLSCWAAAMLLLGAGLLRLDASVHLANFIDSGAPATRDAAWFEENLGSLEPLEIIVTIPPERLRAASEYAEQDGQQYRLTMAERIELMRDLQRRVENLPIVSGALSAATFAPPSIARSGRRPDRHVDYAVSKSLEQHRKLLMASDFMQLERQLDADAATGRELWRLSARVDSSVHGAAGSIDGEQAIRQLKHAVEPVLLAYQQRDRITQALHERGKSLAGARVCVLFRAPDQATKPPELSQEAQLATLLRRSGAAPRGVSYFNLSSYDQPKRQKPQHDDEYRTAAVQALTTQDLVVLVSASRDPTVSKLATCGVTVADVTDLPSIEESMATQVADGGGPRPIRAVFTGAVPLVQRAEQELAAGVSSAVIAIASLVFVVLVLSLRNVVSGLIAAAACAFPLVAAFGALGWIGAGADVGTMIAASLALALAVAGSVHFLTWFQRGLDAGLSRAESLATAYEHCAEPMQQSTIIAAIGLSVFALSTLAPMQQFAFAQLAMLGLALAGSLLVLPAILASPVGLAYRSLSPADRRRPAVKAAEVHGPPAPHIRTASPPAEFRPAEPAQPPRVRGVVSADDRRDVAHGPHAALHAKLQELRRAASRDAPGSAEV